MKAYGFTEHGGPETQTFLDLPTPEPGPSELLVAVHAAGVNPADVKIRAGAFGPAASLPAVMGREASGVVEAVGRDVDGFAPGDEVFGTVAPTSGAFAEHALLTAASAARKPPQVSFADAATLPVAGATAYDALAQLGLAAGQTLLVVGIGGGVGVVAAQLGRDAGLTVVGTASESKRELVESLDATLVTYGDGVADRIRQILPDGVDGILDLIGGDALRAVAGLGGRIVSTADPDTAAGCGGEYVRRAQPAGTLAALAQLVAAGKLDPHVEDVLPLDEAPAAIAAVEGGHPRGKVVVAVR
ncbi:MAG TPA: NADP-dependent oxidoreductase [Mycobacteriales bacterium]|nr:NADP-dependent oxidoreductase [Mycobacteriales bacterium]